MKNKLRWVGWNELFGGALKVGDNKGFQEKVERTHFRQPISADLLRTLM